MNENCDNNEPRNRTKYTYDNANNVFTVAYPNSVTTTYGYDQLNRVSGLGYTTQTGVYTYQRDNAGNLTNASEPSGRQLVWNYDGINRVTQETISSAPSGKNGNLAYGLDPVGNRTSATSISGLAPISGTFDLDDELSSEGYSDRNGNVTSAVTAAGSKTFTYDSENHLISMGGTVSMLYDGDGNRVKKTTSSGATMYLVDDLNPTGYPQVVEELTNGAASRTYTYGLQRISQYQPINGTPSFYQYDGGGNVRQLTIITGAVTDQYEYDAFGNEFTVSGGSNTPNEFMYRGEQYDSDLGLYYLRARYYNPLTGRFMSRDPEDGNTADPNTLHKYLYANGDPVNMEDPTGHAAYIESIFTRTLVSSPLELGAEYVGLTVGAELCAYAKFVVQATTGWPSNLQSPAGVPLWSLKALAIICSATGF
jgi:RHS repeat-associated protein